MNANFGPDGLLGTICELAAELASNHVGLRRNHSLARALRL